MSIREAMAYHEAGHAVVAISLGIQVKKVTIKPTRDFHGRVTHAPVLTARDIRRINEGSETPHTRDRMEKLAMVCLAGPMAQQRFKPRSWRDWHGASDFEHYGDIVLKLGGGGESLRLYGELLTVWTESKLNLWWPTVELVAAELLECETLGCQDVGELMSRSVPE